MNDAQDSAYFAAGFSRSNPTRWLPPVGYVFYWSIFVFWFYCYHVLL